MLKIFKYITLRLSLLFLLGISQIGYSQNYPVDCRVLLRPPFSGQMSEIVSSPLKFKVQLLLKDLTKPSVEVSLRLRLKGQGVWLENPEGFVSSQPIILTPGIPKILSALELAENFGTQNIEAQGIDYSQLLNGLLLPFGFYEWEVVAIEHNRFRQVSNLGTAKFYIQNNYPPLLNMPADGSIVPATTPQNLLFSWTPRHITPALGSGGLIYHLYLYEVPTGEDPAVVVNSGSPYMQELLADKPNYIYGSTGLPLTEGERYAWQVRVESLNGEVGFFNNGYSDIKSFVYGHLPCPPPTNLQAKVDADDGSVQLSWDAPTDALSYKLAYYTLPNGVKTERSVLVTEHLLIQQPVGYQYQWEVKAVCQQAESQSTVSNFELTEKPKEEETWDSDPELIYEPESPIEPDPEVIQTSENPQKELNDPQTTEEEITALFNTSTKIYIPAEDKELPENLPKQLSVVPPNPTIEQLQEALKTNKPTCAGITASYSCGNHDNVPQYNGTIIPVSAGDEIAMNSLVLSVVSIDGSGNGEGLIKIPMMNNIKLGVTLSGIQVAKGGCVVAGRAELSGVSASLLTDKQRVALEKAYIAYNQTLDVAYENAGAIAETYNSLTDLYEGMEKKTQAMLDKFNSGEKISQRDTKALEEMKKQATVATDKMIEALKTKFGSEGSEEFIAFIKSTTESCVCSADTEKPKKGPNAEFYSSFDDDCKKCLEEQKKKQEQAVQVIKKVQKVLIVKMQCGCFSWGNIMNDLGHYDEKCEEVINRVEMVKNAIKTGKSLPTTDLTIQGQVLIGNVCYTDLQVVSIQGNLDPKKFEINSDGITFKNVLTFNISEPDNRKMKVELLRKYLFKEVKEVEKDTLKGKYVPPEGAVDVSLLQTSELGKKMLRISEGCTATAPKKDRRKGYLYVDSKGYCTFGIGHLIRKGDCTSGDELEWGGKTWNEALVDFENGKLKEFEEIVKRHIEVPVTQSEFDAMVSFAFNVGEGDGKSSSKYAGFSGSQFIRTLNGKIKGKDKGTREPDLMYNFKDNPNRRKSEVELFKTGEYKHYTGGKDISTLKIACDGK